IVSLLLLGLVSISDQAFAASLTGINRRDHNEEEELRLSTTFSWTPTTPSEKTYTHTPSQPLRKSWLPPLRFQEPPEEVHPALKAELQTPAQSSITVDLLPPPISQLSFTAGRSVNTNSHPTLTRSQTVATSSSSIYSYPNSSSTFSRHPSTLSSFSNNSRGSTPKSSPLSTISCSSKPDVPKIPQRYRRPNHILRESGTPIRPGSTPAMPPSAFWLYARNIQQKYNTILAEEAQNDQPKQQQRIPSHSPRKRDISTCRYPLIQPSPEKATPLHSNTSRHNTMRVAKQGSYERLRKGKSLQRPPTWAGKADLDRRLAAAGVARDAAFEKGNGARRRSRTLVKKRQPWDASPRVEGVDVRRV
ncbi:MAG: hypothetical protein Q9164_007104, partial [Protoblastenia rupestris]